MAEIISGKDLAQSIIAKELCPRVKKLETQNIIPKLVVILVGENPASQSYIRQKEKFAKEAGITSEVKNFPGKFSEKDLLSEIELLNNDESVHGIIVQLPLPEQISVEKVIAKISTEKDVDGFSAENLGKLLQGQKCLECCTPKGIIRMIESVEENLSGKKVVVIGRSNIVGKPVASLALNKNATVTICHSKTKNLQQELQNADIIIVAVGRPKFLQGKDLPAGCTVIDVGIHRQDNGKLCGDVDFPSAEKVVSKISPVPGGVGPMTVVSLIENVIQAAENRI